MHRRLCWVFPTLFANLRAQGGLRDPWVEYTRRVLTEEEFGYLRTFHQALSKTPLDPGDPRYVALYQRRDLAMDDPVELLARGILWNDEGSTQLLSGFRGTGKSTELRRLKKQLEGHGYVVLLGDIEEYLNTTVPIDVTDFLMFLAGCLGDGLAREGVADRDALQGGFWARLVTFFGRINLEEVKLGGKLGPEVAGVKVAEVNTELKLNLKQDNTFRAALQRALAGHVGALLREVQKYVDACGEAVREARPKSKGLVLLIDSLEHLRGTFANANEVQASVESLFVAQSDKLRLRNLHQVFTVPPWMKVRHAQIGAYYDGFQMLPAIRVTDKQSQHAPFQPGIQALEAVVRARERDWERLLGARARLDRLITLSGGHMRDLFGLLQEVLKRAEALPVSEHVLEAAITAQRSQMSLVADEHAEWLFHIMQSNRASLEEAAKLPDLARFLDTHQVLGYRNGDEWYDVHPLIAEVITEQVTALRKRRGAPLP